MLTFHILATIATMRLKFCQQETALLFKIIPAIFSPSKPLNSFNWKPTTNGIKSGKPRRSFHTWIPFQTGFPFIPCISLSPLEPYFLSSPFGPKFHALPLFPRGPTSLRFPRFPCLSLLPTRPECSLSPMLLFRLNEPHHPFNRPFYPIGQIECFLNIF